MQVNLKLYSNSLKIFYEQVFKLICRVVVRTSQYYKNELTYIQDGCAHVREDFGEMQ